MSCSSVHLVQTVCVIHIPGPLPPFILPVSSCPVAAHLFMPIMADTCISRDFPTEEEAIKAYFSLGLTHGSILTFLKEYHGVNLSIRTLRRRLHQFGLKRHNSINCTEESLMKAVQSELASSCGTVGYRQIWHQLRVRHHLTVSRAKVSKVSLVMSSFSTK